MVNFASGDNPFVVHIKLGSPQLMVGESVSVRGGLPCLVVTSPMLPYCDKSYFISLVKVVKLSKASAGHNNLLLGKETCRNYWYGVKTSRTAPIFFIYFDKVNFSAGLKVAHPLPR